MVELEIMGRQSESFASLDCYSEGGEGLCNCGSTCEKLRNWMPLMEILKVVLSRTWARSGREGRALGAEVV